MTDINCNIILIVSGLVAGLVNFFTNYIGLPFTRASSFADDPTKLKDIWWVAMIGYSITGIAGAFLTPLMNALLGTGLKGLPASIDPKNLPMNYYYILFGYGLVFGYSTTRLLVSLLDSISKRITALESKTKELEQRG